MNSEFDSTLADDLLDGAKAFARFTGFSVRRTFYLLEAGELPGGKIGNKWTGSKKTVRQYLQRVTGPDEAA